MCGLMLVCCVVAVGGTLFMTSSQKTSAVRFNMAGRQRMLTQRYAGEFADSQNIRQLRNSAAQSADVISQQISSARTYYAKQVVGKLKKEVESVSFDPGYHNIAGAIPPPATFVREIAESLNDSSECQTSLLSKWPINSSMGLSPGPSTRAWEALRKNPSKPYQEFVLAESGEGAELFHAVADTASVQSCVTCHNTHPNSPKKDFRLGELMGILVVSVPVTSDATTAKALVAPADGKNNVNQRWMKTAELFRTTLDALRDGGPAFTSLAMTDSVTLEAEMPGAIRTALDKVDEQWSKLERASTAIQTTPTNSPAYLSHLAVIQESVDICLARSNKVVGLLETKAKAAVASMESLLLVTGSISLVVFLIVLVYLRAKVTGPLRAALRVADAVAAGDLTQSCKVDTTDEVGQLSQALNKMCDDLKTTVNGIHGTAASLGSSAGTLSGTSSELVDGAAQTTNQASTVAAAAEELSTNMSNMAGSTDQMTSNVRRVAASVEEMTVSIGEIAKNAEQASVVATNAAELAEVSNTNIAELGSAADEIGNVIETIQDIAEQTNLLALNATIEAARAGDAGKGFAVVATEVKELAKQTAEATEDIGRRIAGIQASTGSAVDSVNRISDVIVEVNEVSKTIAAAVEEQSITTKEIAGNIKQTSEAAQMVSVAVGESAQATQEITLNITKVDTVARQTANGAANTQSASGELTSMATRLQDLVGVFKTDD